MQTVLFLKSQRARLALQYHSSVLNLKSQMAGLCCLIHAWSRNFVAIKSSLLQSLYPETQEEAFLL